MLKTAKELLEYQKSLYVIPESLEEVMKLIESHVNKYITRSFRLNRHLTNKEQLILEVYGYKTTNKTKTYGLGYDYEIDNYAVIEW